MPNGSRVPCTTSVGTVTASSSGSRLCAGSAPDRRGGCSGNARQSTPDGADGLRSAAGDTRARGPPTDDERQTVQLACDADGRSPPSTLRRVDAREQENACPRPGRAARRARRSLPPSVRRAPPRQDPSPARRHLHRDRARARPAARPRSFRCAFAVPNGVSISSVFTETMLPRRSIREERHRESLFAAEQNGARHCRRSEPPAHLVERDVEGAAAEAVERQHRAAARRRPRDWRRRCRRASGLGVRSPASHPPAASER